MQLGQENLINTSLLALRVSSADTPPRPCSLTVSPSPSCFLFKIRAHATSTSPSPPSFSGFIGFLPAAAGIIHLRWSLDSGGMFSPLCFSAKCPATSGGGGRLFFLWLLEGGANPRTGGAQSKVTIRHMKLPAKIIALHTPAKAMRGGCTFCARSAGTY